MILAEAFEIAFRPDGWVHFVVEGRSVTRGPVGVLLYLALVPAYWFVPRAHRSAYLIASSLLLALVTLGHAYTITLAALALIGLAVVRGCGTPARRRLGAGLLVAWFTALLLYPQPPWLPQARETELLYFYLHWAGIGYLFLKTLHVLADVAAGRTPQPAAGDFLAYLLFAPTLRMGPIYRYGEFTRQLHGDPRRYRNPGTAALRLCTGLLRLGIMMALLEQFPLEQLFHEPQTLSAGELVVRIYLAPMTFYLWVSGYIDLTISVGRTMGFAVPENFNYPWRATDISDFWRRWHITLGDWLRDYIFIPLVRRRWHFAVAFIATFLFIGIWHAPWPCYLLWGLGQGIGLTVRRFWLQFWKRRRQGGSPLYQRLARARLVGSPVSIALSWLVTFHYEIATLTIGIDVHHAGRLIFRRVTDLLGLA